MHQTTISTSGCAQIFLIVFGLFFAGFAVVWMLMAWLSGGGIVFALFGIPFVVIGLVMIAIGAMQFVARARVGTPTITVSSDTLRVGERFTCHVEHTFKSNVNAGRILLQLVQRETARYRRGTDTYTVTHEDIAAEFDLPARAYRRGETLYDDRTLQIPRQGMHTFKAINNQIQWFVRMKIEVTGWPDVVQEKELVVLPELVKEAA
ncbi:MAG: hypothetical protein D6784_08560 [Chloroflexi bacterium]|nr:MAG: hypothetical protein D6784_08560 [Chloroflexota bacterium]